MGRLPIADRYENDHALEHDVMQFPVMEVHQFEDTIKDCLRSLI